LYLAKGDVASLPQSEEKEGIEESLEAIEKSVDYVNKIVADLQDFARPLKPHAEQTNLQAVADEVLAKSGLPEKIEITVKIAKEAKIITADPAYVKRIIGNLISNAVQAMPNGGKLNINATRQKGNAVITVQDTGVGIPEDVKPKLFQPLFTTKSKGQGFGLAVVKRITEAQGGTVTFTSEEGKGTCFTITLPQNT
jgi:signal transduction histidine kinase